MAKKEEPAVAVLTPVEEALKEAAEVGQGNPQPAETTFAEIAAKHVALPDDLLAAEPLRMDNVEYKVGDYIPTEAFAKNGALPSLLAGGVVKRRAQMASHEEIQAESEAIQAELDRLRGLLLEQGIDPNKL